MVQARKVYSTQSVTSQVQLITPFSLNIVLALLLKHFQQHVNLAVMDRMDVGASCWDSL